MCGIYGQVANSIDKIVSDKIKILGILNEERGVNSCGVTVDADIFLGVEFNNRKFTDFAKSADFTPSLLPVVFGHNRKNSVGAINVHNAHPFGFGTSLTTEGFEFIGAHNGTIHNYEEMAEEFGVSIKTMNGNETRSKIDSEVLLESIYRSKSLKPLSYYNGGAALIWYTPDDGKFYMFSGESKNYATAVNAEIERPLHVWVESENNFYFSSEKLPLLVLGASEEEIFQIETNTVHIIENGDFNNCEKLKISRLNNTQKKVYNNTTANNNYRLPTQTTSAFNGPERHGYLNDEKGTKSTTQGGSQASQERSKDSALLGIKQPRLFSKAVPSEVITSRPLKMIEDEDYRGRTYCRAMRYYRNGHPLKTGIYIYIQKHGFHEVGKTQGEALEYFNQHVHKHFDVVDQVFVTRILSIDEKRNPRYSSISTSISSTGSPCFYYIAQGFILKAFVDYVHIQDNPRIYFDRAEPIYHTLSYVTKFPIFCPKGSDANTFLEEGSPMVGENYITGPCTEYVIKTQHGKITKLNKMNITHLEGLDMQNDIEFEEQIQKAKDQLAKDEEEKAKIIAIEPVVTQTVEEATQRSEGFSQATGSLKRYLISWINVEPVCTIDTYDELEILADNVESVYEDYLFEMEESKNDAPAKELFVQYCLDSSRILGIDFSEKVFDIVAILQERIKTATRKSEVQNKSYIRKTREIISLILQN